MAKAKRASQGQAGKTRFLIEIAPSSFATEICLENRESNRFTTFSYEKRWPIISLQFSVAVLLFRMKSCSMSQRMITLSVMFRHICTVMSKFKVSSFSHEEMQKSHFLLITFFCHFRLSELKSGSSSCSGFISMS